MRQSGWSRTDCWQGQFSENLQEDVLISELLYEIGLQMRNPDSARMWEILACPSCNHDLKKTENGAVCIECQSEYDYSASGALDLRLKNRKSYSLEFELITPPFPKSEFDFKLLNEIKKPEVDFSGISVPFHLTRELLSNFPKAKGEGSFMLDLGCGNTIHREICELAGFEYIGLDYHSPQATFMGDAHSLPFKNESFEFILSIAVLEHVRFPFIMMREAFRVLKRKGKFVGTVSFLEPFHGDSFYHHTHFGVHNSLKFGGFKVEKISPNKKWSALRAQAAMGLFPKMPHFLSASLVLPLQMLSVLWWKMGNYLNPPKTEIDRLYRTAGSFSFIATKE